MATINAINNTSTVFSVSTGDLTVTTGNLNLAASNAGGTAGTINFNSVMTGRILSEATFWGGDSGGAYGLRNGNTGIGYKTLYNQTNDPVGYNTCVGAYAGYNTGDNGDTDLGCKNVFIGYEAGKNNRLNRYNTAVGFQALYNAGSYAGSNTCLGYQAGYNIDGVNQSNVCIASPGLADEQFTMRLGTPGAETSCAEGAQNNCYIAGVYTMGAALGGTAKIVLVDSDAKVGGLAGSAGQVLQGGTTPAFSTATYPSTVATGDIIAATNTNVIGVIAGTSATANYNLVGNGSGVAPTWQIPNQVLFINPQTDTYALLGTDAGKLVTMDKGSANTLTVSKNATQAIAIGAQIVVTQLGAGVTTIAPEDGGVTLRYDATDTLVLNGQYATAALIKIDTDVWLVGGKLTPA